MAFEIFDSYVLRFECLFLSYTLVFHVFSLCCILFLELLFLQNFNLLFVCFRLVCCFVLISDCFAVLDFDVSGFAVSNNGDKTD